MKTIGPMKIFGSEVNGEFKVPLATFEQPVWHSVNRGAKISRLAGGVRAVIIDDRMTRSVLLEAPTAEYANQVVAGLRQDRSLLKQAITATSNFAKLLDWHVQIVGNLLYIRFAFTTGDAAGHNIATKAAEALLGLLLKKYRELNYISISGNFCVDKKNSAVNGILGRGKYVIAEVVIPEQICRKHLRTLPEKIINLNIKKNLIGSIIAGSVRTANAHFANMLLALYLATGQDAANIVEGSQGITHAELRGKDMYFSVTLPNIIVGTVGSGKDIDFVQDNLAMLGCLEMGDIEKNARRLAIITAVTVLCGEISLLAAQTNPGELVNSHIRIER